jgi:MFS family permease
MLGVSLVGPFVSLRIEQLYGGLRSQLPLIIGLIISGNGLAMALSTPLWGRLSDRIGYVPVLRIGALSVGALLLAQSLSQTLWLFGATRVGQGLVQGGIDAALVALVALHTPDDRRASILNLSRLPLQFSWFLGPILGASLAAFGLGPLFGAAAALALLGGAAALLLNVSESARPEHAVQPADLSGSG